MSLIINTAKNINWRVSVKTGLDVDLSNHIQNITVPSISFTEVEQGYRNRKAKIYSETPAFGSIDIEFLLDDEFKLLEHLYDWAFELTEDSKTKLFGDIRLELLDSYQNIKGELAYGYVIPTDIQGFELSTSVDNLDLKVNCTLAFSSFEYKFNKD